MKSALRWCVVPLLATTLLAQTAPTKPKKKTAAKPAAQPAVTAADVQALRDALAAQQQQIQQLRDEMQRRDQALQQAQQQLQQAQSAATDAQQKAASVETVANAQKDSVAQLSSDVADVKTTLTNTAVSAQDEQKRMSALEGLVGRFRFNGDVRVRGESFFQGVGPAATSSTIALDRQRARIRVRFGVDGKLNEDFTGGVYLATGSLGDPTTTNETLTNFFDRKTIALDKGFITYNPVAHKWVSVTGGKFAYTWNRTSQTFDPDLNPEGFSEKFSFDLKTPFLKNVTLQAMQLLFNESSAGTDSYALGGHFSGRFQLGPLTSTPSFTLLKWNNPDAILQASAFAVQSTTTGTNPGATTPVSSVPVPGEGPGCAKGGPSFPPCFFAPNGMTNATYTDGSGKPHFYSQWMYADFILNNQVQTPIARLPLNILLEYEDNLNAKAHPLDSKGNVISSFGSQSKEYGFDVSFGQTRNKNDVQFGYAWLRQEQDSAIASFTESDQRAPTNILQNRFYALWKLRSNTVASYTFWYGRTLNTGLENATKGPGTKTGQVEPYLKRMQFDLIYSF